MRPGRRDLIPGGRAAGRDPSEFDPGQLRMGCKVELEHTPDRRMACEIAMDHLAEDPRYYTKLRAVHLDGPSALVVIPWAVGAVVLVGAAIALARRLS